MTIQWPIKTLAPSDIAVDLIYATRSPGDPWDGRRQIQTALVSEWRLSMTIPLGSEERVRAFRAMKTVLKGRYTAINIPICDPYRVRRTDAGWPTPVGPGIPFSDEALFSDDSGWAYPDITTTVAIAGSEGDAEIAIEVDSIGDTLGAGHRFSINDFLYEVPFDGVGARVSDRRTFSIAPELRADVAVGAEVRIGRPIIRARLADDLSGAGALHLGKFASPTMEFVEVFAR